MTASNQPLLFLDWLNVNHGSMELSLDESQLSEYGRNLAAEDRARSGGVFPDLTGRWMIRRKIPHGIRITVEKAEVSEPWLHPDQPWEQNLAWVTVLREEDKFRCWYHSHIPPVSGQPDRGYRLCYAESLDGWNWVKPSLGKYEFEGSTANNITGPFGFEASVFRDDQCPAEERYKTFDRESASPAGPGEPLREPGLYVCVSPDGLSWKRHPKCLIHNFCDTQNVAWWDPQHRRYFGYLRSRLAGRAIGLSETDDFFDWPEPHIVLHPGAEDDPAIDYYTPGFTPYPDMPGLRLFFVAIYRHDTDQTHIRLAISHDGRSLHWVSREPIVDAPPLGSHYAGPNLVRLGDGRMGMPCRMAPYPHNATHGRFYRSDAPDVRDRPRTHIGWLLWQESRLAGIQADHLGEFFTHPMECQGGHIQINARTAGAGELEVELWEVTTGRHSKPIPGYGFEACRPLRGDILWQTVQWNGRSSLEALRGRQIEVRIRLSCAKIFGLRQS